MRWAIAVVVMLTIGMASGVARADDPNLATFLLGPVIGLRLSGPSGHRAIIGFEGGAGYGPERLNLGFEHRSDTDFFYAEIDPWYLIGGTFGLGVDSNGKTSNVLGVWEGIPLSLGDERCNGWNNIITLAGGYRYTGVHELYLTVKGGRMFGSICFDDSPH